MRYFHGTTIDNAVRMYQSDFVSQKPSGTWKCSDDLSSLFLWPFDKIAEENFDEDYDNDEDITNSCIMEGFKSAVITAALNNVLRRELVVFEFEFDEGVVSDDYSTKSMSEISSSIYLSEVSCENIKRMYLCRDGYEPMYRFFHLVSLIDNEELNHCLLSDDEIYLIHDLEKVNFYPIIDIEWEEVTSIL